MERTAIRLGGVELSSSVMNASGPHSAERGEIYELSAQHQGALVFKSCNIAGLDAPENLKNRGVEHFAAIARELVPRHKMIIASVVGNTEDEIVKVAGILDRAGVKIVELNLADDYVMNSVAPFAVHERLKALIGRVRGEIGAALAVKLPPKPGAIEAAGYRRPAQGDGRRGRGMRQRPAQGPGDRHRHRPYQGRRASALAGAYVLAARRRRVRRRGGGRSQHRT